MIHKLKLRDPAEEQAALNSHLAQMRQLREDRKEDHRKGIPALERLFEVAQRDSGQPRHIAAFLLGLYNGTRFPFDLTDLRCIDRELFDDCMLVLRMDRSPEQEVHCYFEGGGRLFEALARDKGIRDRTGEPVEAMTKL